MKSFCIVVLSTLVAQSALGGTVIFNNRVFGEVVSPIYGPELSDITLTLQGNTASGTPSGSVSYTGLLLSGSGYTAELWGGPKGTPEALLQPIPGAVTVFRTDRPGYIDPTPSVVDIPGVGTGDQAELQLRVWENATAGSWTAAVMDPLVLRGVSLPFLSRPLGGPNATGPDSLPGSLAGLTSFNIHAVPEPSAVGMGLILLGYAINRFCRRGK